MEKIFETSLNRLQKIYDITGDKKFKLESLSYRDRLRNLENRLENILAEMYYKYVIEPKAVKEIRNGYMDFDKDMDFLTFDKYGYCEELWKDYFILVNEELFNSLFEKTKQKEINNIEKHNLKLL